MNRFDNGHTAAPRPHFLDPPPQPQPRPSLILGGPIWLRPDPRKRTRSGG